MARGADSAFAAAMKRAAAAGKPSRADRAARLVFVLGDQLDDSFEPLKTTDPAKDVVLMAEVRAESTHVPSHRQRATLFLSAMRHFALRLAESGRRVRYVTLEDPANTHTLAGELSRAVTELRAGHIVMTRPGEHRLERELSAGATRLAVPVTMHEDPSFFTTTAQFEAWAGPRKSLTMEFFYREQRRRLGVLVDDSGEPEGGTWNYDADNRLSFKSAPAAPAPARFEPDEITREVMAMVERTMPRLPGRMERFGWAVTREHAQRQMDDFVRRRLPDFGPYEDAMWTGEPWLFHAQMSPAMNLKLIDPRAMLTQVLAAHRNRAAPLQSVEGFVRQIIGWREFIRGVYHHEGPEYETRNALDHAGSLPEFYWTGATDMRCLRDCIGQVLDHGYAHHIQRLMITGNFALIAGVHPKAVSDWYLGMYVDAVDWVTLPNTLGMSQHADGGVVGTKPYAASANYIGKMSNYCKGCRYDPKKRTGENACPFNTLYWDFLIRHRERFSCNQRMSMMMKNVDRLSKVQVTEITREGRRLKDKFGVTPS